MRAISLLCLTTLLWLAVPGGPVAAQISVSRSIIELSNEARIQDVEIRNDDEQRFYLDLAVAEIVDPGGAGQKRVELEDPRTAAVLVSPRQLLMSPGARKRVRVILRADIADSDRVFRLRVQPHTGKASYAGGSAGGNKTSAIRVLLGYDLLLLARPSTLNPDVRATRDGDTMEFRNAGNTNVLLRRIVQCEGEVDPDEAADGTCVELAPARLYSGQTYRLSLPRAGPAERFPVTVWQSVGLDHSTESY